MPRMYDKRGRGDSGPVSMALRYTKKDGIEMVHDTRPLVGYAMRVGSLNARSYQSQDWWQTTPIEEIISETEDEVVFRTVNGSTYTWNV